MLAAIGAILSSIVNGIVGPLFGYLGKKQDVTLEGFKSASAEDLAAYQAYLAALNQANAVKVAQQSNPWFAAITFLAGGFSVAYFGSIVLDSMFHLGWRIDKLPAPWDSYVWIVLQSFVVITPAMPLISATSAWLRK
jgi:hypothetical protein